MKSRTRKQRRRNFQGTRDYGAYLLGQDWLSFRARIIQDRRAICQFCGRWGIRLEVHHLTYERVTRERPGDVIVLCDACHTFVHGNSEVSNALKVLLLPKFRGWERAGSTILAQVVEVIQEAAARDGYLPAHIQQHRASV